MEAASALGCLTALTYMQLTNGLRNNGKRKQ